MLAGLLALLACQLVGEVVVHLLGLELPGPVVGMLVFLVVLRLRRPADDHPLVVAPQELLSHLQLLFIPAGVGLMTYAAAVRADWLPLLGGLVGSWVLGIVVTGAVAALLLRRRA